MYGGLVALVDFQRSVPDLCDLPALKYLLLVYGSGPISIRVKRCYTSFEVSSVKGFRVDQSQHRPLLHAS